MLYLRYLSIGISSRAIKGKPIILLLRELCHWYKLCITKTCPYNFDPHKPHFYIVKLGFTGVYISFFLFLLKNIDCGYSLELPIEAVLTSTHNLCFEQKYEKYQNFLSENFHFLVVKCSVYLSRHVFVNDASLQFWPKRSCTYLLILVRQKAIFEHCSS